MPPEPEPVPRAIVTGPAVVRAARRRGLVVAARGLVAAMVPLAVIRLHLLGVASIAVLCASIIGWIMFAVGIIQAISGHDEKRQGNGVLRILLVVVIAGPCICIGFLVALSGSHRPPTASAESESLQQLRDIEDGLAHATTESSQGSAGSAAIPARR